MATKKIIERNLPLNTTYQFVSITRGSVESGQTTCCDNCGQLITNIVTVVNKDGKYFHIGTDCSETLIKASAIKMLKFQDYDLEMYTLRQVNRFMTLANKPDSKVTEEGMVFVVEYNHKGETKTAQQWVHTIRQFYPEFKAS